MHNKRAQQFINSSCINSIVYNTRNSIVLFFTTTALKKWTSSNTKKGGSISFSEMKSAVLYQLVSSLKKTIGNFLMVLLLLSGAFFEVSDILLKINRGTPYDKIKRGEKMSPLLYLLFLLATKPIATKKSGALPLN